MKLCKQKQKSWKHEAFSLKIWYIFVICDEICVQCDNHKRSAQWLDKDKSPKHTTMRNIHQKKSMVSVWRSSAGVMHNDFMKPGSSITAEIYRNQLDEMMQKSKKNSLDWSNNRLLSYCMIMLEHIQHKWLWQKLQEFEFEHLY